MDEVKNTQTTTPAPAQDLQKSLDEKLAEAKLAMEGLEHTEKRLEEERTETASKEIAELEAKLAKLEKEKERYEIEWVKQDDKRQAINRALKPILEAEKLAEESEATLELEETKAGLPQQKMAVEKKRWEADDVRRQAEKEKWELQQNLWKFDSVIEANTKEYRAILEEEDKLKNRLQELKTIIPTQ
ncbi:MAG: hypothetical protein AAB453_01580 [Patescibacteria group bacterium]